MNDPTILFFAGLAIFLCYRLYSVLGTRGGHEPDDTDRFAPQTDETAAALSGEDAGEFEAAPAAPTPGWVKTVQEEYPGFDGDHFLDGAKSAYEMIVQGFAAGDLGEIAPFLDPQVEATFDTAISARRDANQEMEVTFVGIEKVEVVSAHATSDTMNLMVSFQSDQIRVVRDDAGEVVDGDPNRIDLVRDRWTFSRPLNSNDPNWTLTATDGAAPAAS